MDIKKYINSECELLEMYEYFLSLGYSDKAATVMAFLKYGDHLTACFVRLFPKESILDRIYDYFLECPDGSPQTIIRKYIEEKYDDLPDEYKKYIFVRGKSNISPSANVNMLGAGAMPQSMMTGGAVMGMAASPMMGGAMMSMSMAQPMAASAQMRGNSSGMTGLPAPGFIQPKTPVIDPEKLAYDSYEQIEEKDAKSVLTAPTSTFRMTTSTASVGIMLNQVRSGRNMNMSQVRIEELLNYFDYKTDESKKADKARFHITTELMDKSEDRKLLYINVEADDTPKEHQNIVLLIDTSGSMGSRQNVTFATIATVVSKLKVEDALSLITYSDIDHTILENHIVKGQGDKEDLIGEILGIIIEGCTDGSAGIETAYKLGEKTYRDGWSNQVILMTDGDLNFGITSKDGLKGLIEEKKKTGMFLSVIGTGLYNYQDDKLEVLSKHGNGTYVVVNELSDVKESVDKKYVSLTNIIAKDVKAQVEFNPKYVKKYRLLGYENRSLNHEDFKNDAVISEPYGSGGHGVALYELYMGDATEKPSEELKYQRIAPNDYEELGTVSVRYKMPLSDESEEISEVIPLGVKYTDNSKVAYLLYCISEMLRKSLKLDKNDYKYLLSMIEGDSYKSFTDTKVDVIKDLVSMIDTDGLRTLASSDVPDKDTLVKMGLLRKKPDGSYEYIDTTDRPCSPNNTFNTPMMGFMGMTMLNQMNKGKTAGNSVNVSNGSNGMVDGSYMNCNTNPADAPVVNEAGEWKCPLCGEAKNKGKFCMRCGGTLPEGLWRCDCGRINSGKFCVDCGKPMC